MKNHIKEKGVWVEREVVLSREDLARSLEGIAKRIKEGCSHSGCKIRDPEGRRGGTLGVCQCETRTEVFVLGLKDIIEEIRLHGVDFNE